MLGGCGGGGGAGGGGGGNTIPGTPIGSYNVVVTATSGSMVGTMNVSLTVRKTGAPRLRYQSFPPWRGFWMLTASSAATL